MFGSDKIFLYIKEKMQIMNIIWDDNGKHATINKITGAKSWAKLAEKYGDVVRIKYLSDFPFIQSNSNGILHLYLKDKNGTFKIYYIMEGCEYESKTLKEIMTNTFEAERRLKSIINSNL